MISFEDEIEKKNMLIQTLMDERDFYKNFFENSEVSKFLEIKY